MVCSNAYYDNIIGCPENITVYGILSPTTNYFWEITDHFGNIYKIPFTTDSAGIGIIDVSQLPEGFCNPYMSQFTVRVKLELTSCEYVQMVIPQKFEELVITSNAGNLPKSFIGCSIGDFTLPGFLTNRYQFTGASEQTVFPLEDDTDYAAIVANLKNAKQVLVFNESGLLQEGEGANQYIWNKVDGKIEFNQVVTDQLLTIITLQ